MRLIVNDDVFSFTGFCKNRFLLQIYYDFFKTDFFLQTKKILFVLFDL